MKLQTFLNKFTNSEFLLSVDGWCDELPFSEYDYEKSMDYWVKYKDREIESFSIIMTNFKPELTVKLK